MGSAGAVSVALPLQTLTGLTCLALGSNTNTGAAGSLAIAPDRHAWAACLA